MAITSPLLEDVSINGATGILVNITGGPDLTLTEVNEACSLVHEAADPDANIIFGSVIDPNLSEEVRITVIATGFQSRVAVETSTFSGRPQVKKLSENQMTLPMHSPPSETVIAVASSVAGACPKSPPPAPGAYAVVAPVVTSSVAPVSAAMDAEDTEVEIEACELLRYPPLPLLATPGPVTPPLASLAGSDSRPVIRPAVASPIATASAASSARRVTASGPAALATAHLGIEESEFDKPTYLRRAMAGEGLRSPGEGKV